MTENRRLIRTQEGRILIGVCAGLGRYTRIDPVVFRVGFAVLTLAGGGTGIFLYVAAYLMMPPDEIDGAVAEKVLKRRLDGDAVLTALGAVLTISALFSVFGSSFSGGAAGGPLTVVTVFALALLVAHARGVNLVQVARTLPERFQGQPYRAERRPPPPPPSPEGMIDLATLSTPIELSTPRSPAAGPEAGPAGGTASGTAGVTRVLPTEPLPPGPPGDWDEDRDEDWDESELEPAAEPPSSTSCRRSGLPLAFLAAATVAGAGAVPFTSGQSAAVRVSISLAATLAVLGLGLIIASWYGRSGGLISLGVVLCLALVTTSAVGELPQGSRWGDVSWRPVAVQADHSYRIAVGDGNLDLTGLPLRPGQRVQVWARVMLGALTVTIPGTVQTEVHARIAVGDVSVDGKVTSGPGAKVTTVLPAEGAAGKAVQNAPVIELHIRGRLGDVEVRRG